MRKKSKNFSHSIHLSKSVNLKHACENNHLKCQLLSSVGNRVKQKLMNQLVTCACFLKKANIATDIQLKVKRNISKQMHDLML